MDVSAVALCKDNKMPIRVFDFAKENSIIDILQNKEVGTTVGE